MAATAPSAGRSRRPASGASLWPARALGWRRPSALRAHRRASGTPAAAQQTRRLVGARAPRRCSPGRCEPPGWWWPWTRTGRGARLPPWQRASAPAAAARTCRPAAAAAMRRRQASSTAARQTSGASILGPWQRRRRQRRRCQKMHRMQQRARQGTAASQRPSAAPCKQSQLSQELLAHLEHREWESPARPPTAAPGIPPVAGAAAALTAVLIVVELSVAPAAAGWAAALQQTAAAGQEPAQ